MAGAVLVTGATGFLGRHVLGALAGTRPVHALVRQPEEWRRYDWTAELPGISILEGGLDDAARWSAALPPLAAIVHLAAPVQHSRRAPPALRAAIVDGTLAMVRLAAEKRCRLVVASTSGAVGCSREPGPRAVEDAPYVESMVGGWPYYAAKIEMEKRARALAAERGVPLVLVRAPILLGPGDHRFRSTSNVLKFLRGKMPFLIRGGMHFADVRDAAQAFARIVEQLAPRPVYHLDGHESSVEAFFDLASEVSGVPRTRVVLPYRVAWLVSRALERFHVVPDPVVVEMASHWWGLSGAAAAEDLDWKARDPRETLRDTVSWLRAHAPELAADR
jgi:nucleoside-diphosphate-sugar epimerase